MKQHLLPALALLSPAFLHAADLPPDKGTTIPESSKRPVVVTLGAGKGLPAAPKAQLPPGFTLTTAAAAPLVTHPIAGCLDDKGRLFLGDAVGVNWRKAELEANPPNRVLMLEDTDKDGAYDKSTIFADKMTFPQGAQWLDGSLYVMSPPGLWKLTDTDNDGVADDRKMIVDGFDYTGNAADVHGPFLHPNGRLYWCHGRKGYKVVENGSTVHEGKSSGIWSCEADGTDVQWHSLLAGDNPVEVDFTPEGDIIGVQNLYYSQPRGDTIVHWLYGGVYERADQMKVIAGLPRTLDTMPVMYNFGHVAVSGSCFWHHGARMPSSALTGGERTPSSASNLAPPPLQFMVTHFNTQRVVRMELTPDGSSYKAVENEFLKLESPDIHFTDVLEDPADGSLLVIDTGGWFRIGCPSSLMAKPDVMGAVYRVRPAGAPPAPLAAKPFVLQDICAGLASTNPQARLRACENLAHLGAKADAEQKAALKSLLGQKLDAPLEHAALYAGLKVFGGDGEALLKQALYEYDMDRKARIKAGSKAAGASGAGDVPRYFLVRALRIADQSGPKTGMFEEVLKNLLRLKDPVVSDAAVDVALRHPSMMSWMVPIFTEELERLRQSLPDLSRSPVEAKLLEAFLKKALPTQVERVKTVLPELLSHPFGQQLAGMYLAAEGLPEIQQAALAVLAAQTAPVVNESWQAPLEKLLAGKSPRVPLPLVLDALKKVKDPRFDAALQALADDAARPLPIRLKALDAMKARKVTPETFAMLQSVLTTGTSAAARIQAAEMLASAPLAPDQLTALAPVMATVGPVEMKELLGIMKRSKDAALARLFATELAKNPALISQQESIFRTSFSNHPPELFETIILPARRKAEELLDAKKRQLGPMTESVAAKGDAAAGKKHFETGKGTCMACHKIGDFGRPIGPDLSHIGAIRNERDLLESILFPSQTLARDFEAHILETGDGQTTMGVIKSHTAEGLLVVNVAGQEKNIPHTQIVSDITLPTSLMPMGLDQTMAQQELLDLVAYLRSLK